MGGTGIAHFYTVEVARERTGVISFASMVVIYTLAILALGFVGGQLFEQFMADARAYDMQARV
jgi:nitrate reductase NapE component